MHTTPEQFHAWLDAPEASHFEFKSAAGGFHFDRLVDYCVAIANEGGGKILLGVTDRRPRDVIGTSAFAEPGRTEAGLHQRLAHRIPIEEYRNAGPRVLIVHVPARLPGTAWNIGGRYLKRAGDNLASLGDAELRAIFAETGPDFSAEPCPANLPDLAPAALAEFRARAVAHRDYRLGGEVRLTLERIKVKMDRFFRSMGPSPMTHNAVTRWAQSISYASCNGNPAQNRDL